MREGKEGGGEWEGREEGIGRSVGGEVTDWIVTYFLHRNTPHSWLALCKVFIYLEDWEYHRLENLLLHVLTPR